MAFDLYATVTNQILANLEAGTVPWVKPWSATAGRNMPMNAATGRPYSGANVVLLWMMGGHYNQPHYLTYKQATELGGHVRKGERGHQVVFVKPMTAKPKEGQEAGKPFMMMRAYTVFNIDQCEGLPAKVINPEPAKPRHSDERDATIEEFIKATGADYSETGGNRAYHRHATNSVHMPVFESFKSAALYYSTAFHELGHWTGVKGRLDREFGKRFGDRAYAAEELVAELTSAFLCAEFNIDGNLQHADYVANWIALLKDDSKAFFTAASAAQKAADYMRSRALADEAPDEMPLAA